MRPSIMNIIVENLVAGHNATIMCATEEDEWILRHRIVERLGDLGVKAGRQRGDLRLDNSAVVQFGQLKEYTGRSYMKTPVVVLVDVDEANQCLLPEARAIRCRFPDGKPPILIEC